MQQMPDFKHEQDRRHWITENADYFSVVRVGSNRYSVSRPYQRAEFPRLEEAEQHAQGLVKADPSMRLLIYAVHGVHDTYVKTVIGKTCPGQ